jgi:hypothetical protein
MLTKKWLIYLAVLARLFGHFAPQVTATCSSNSSKARRSKHWSNIMMVVAQQDYGSLPVLPDCLGILLHESLPPAAADTQKYLGQPWSKCCPNTSWHPCATDARAA